ncbi:Scaffold-type E3 ligase [Microsporum audouinii]
MPPSSSQKSAIAQFVSVTGAKDSIAMKCLKANGWKVDQAIDDYFQNGQSGAVQDRAAAVSKIFDKYRDDPDSPDEIGINGAMKYFGDIQVRLDEVACLAVAELLRSPSMGEFTRKEFIEGWIKTTECDTIQKQAAYADSLRNLLLADSDYFRRVYRYTFLLCRMQGQRNVNIEIATEQWQLFFTSENGGIAWETESVPWLKWWVEFIETKHKRPINKDLWEQTEVLMRKTMEDESMDWWSSDAAWPGAIDDFIAFVKEKQGAGVTQQ